MRDRIIEILEDLRPDIDSNIEENLISEGIMESFDLIQLITLLEDEFNIEISSRYVTKDNFDSVDKIKLLVERLVR